MANRAHVGAPAPWQTLPENDHARLQPGVVEWHSTEDKTYCAGAQEDRKRIAAWTSTDSAVTGGSQFASLPAAQAEVEHG